MKAAAAIIDARRTRAHWQRMGLEPADISPLLRCEDNWLAIETNVALRLLRRAARILPTHPSL